MIPSNNNIGIIKNNTTNRAREREAARWTTPLYDPALLARRPIMRRSRKRGGHERTYPRDPSTTTVRRAAQHLRRRGLDHQVILINSLTQKYNILLREGASASLASSPDTQEDHADDEDPPSDKSHLLTGDLKEERQVAPQNDQDDARPAEIETRDSVN